MSGCFWTDEIGCFDDDCAGPVEAGYLALNAVYGPNGGYLYSAYTRVNLYRSGSANPCDYDTAALGLYIAGSLTVTDALLVSGPNFLSTVSQVPDTSSFFPQSFFSANCSSGTFPLPLETATSTTIQYTAKRLGLNLLLPIVYSASPLSASGPTGPNICMADSSGALYIDTPNLVTAIGDGAQAADFDTQLVNVYLRTVCNGRVFFMYSSNL